MSFAEKIINDNFIWDAVMTAISGRRRKNSNTNFVNICCPMCVLRGEKRPDTKFRCGIKNNQPGVGISCYNCNFKTRQVVGARLADNIRDFLIAVGMSEMDVKRLSYRSSQVASLVQSSPEAQAIANIEMTLQFPTKSLPEGAESFDALAARGCTDQDFLDAVDYILGRGEELLDSEYYWTKEPRKSVGGVMVPMSRRLIIPFYFQGNIVGWTARAIDKEVKPRYLTESPSDYLYNADSMYKNKRKYILVVEGVLDANAIDGVSTMGSHLNERQAMWINSFGKQVILVPDRDKNGLDMINIALKYGWYVAFPALTAQHATRNWWDPDVKDCAKALEKYGRLYTLTSVLKSASNHAMEINMKKKWLCDPEIEKKTSAKALESF
jgi:hypothetical protein